MQFLFIFLFSFSCCFYRMLTVDAAPFTLYGSSMTSSGLNFTTNQYLTSNTNQHFLAIQDDGNLCIYGGASPSSNTGEQWCSGQYLDATESYTYAIALDIYGHVHQRRLGKTQLIWACSYEPQYYNNMTSNFRLELISLSPFKAFIRLTDMYDGRYISCSDDVSSPELASRSSKNTLRITRIENQLSSSPGANHILRYSPGATLSLGAITLGNTVNIPNSGAIPSQFMMVSANNVPTTAIYVPTTSFPLVPTSDSGGPDPIKGTTVFDNAYYSVIDTVLSLNYNYQQIAPGSDGSGNYVFSLPFGYEIDFILQPMGSVCGYGSIIASSNPFYLFNTVAVVSSPTTFSLVISPGDSPLYALFGATSAASFASPSLTLSFQLRFELIVQP